VTWAPTGIFLLLAIAGLKLGSALALPVAVALLLSLLLASPLNWLQRRHIPEPVGAAILVLGSVFLLIGGGWFLANPASEWLTRAPSTLSKAERKLTRLSRPFRAIQVTAAKVDDVTAVDDGRNSRVVEVARPSLLRRLSGSSIRFAGNALAVLFLTYFLLAAAQAFRGKLAMVLPGQEERDRAEEILTEIQRQMSRYLWYSGLINLVVGLLTWGVLAWLKYPNAILWGALAGVLNYIPYAGAVATIVLIGLTGLVSFEGLEPALYGAGAFAVINLLEANVVTPAVLGRKLPLNAVAVFLGLMFFGWLWGLTGAILAVPLTVMIRVVCAHLPDAKPVAIFLDN
jgi:predicted PurR-regulated permease PerM